MGIIGILDWENENELTPYPLAQSYYLSNSTVLPDNFIIDAQFFQFNSFIPVITEIQVTETSVLLSIQFDRELVKLTLTSGTTIEYIKLSDNRYVGNILFGSGINTLISSFPSSVFNVNFSFSANTVFTVNILSGVYYVEGENGTGNNVFLNFVTPFGTVANSTFTQISAIYNNPFTLPTGVLRSINGVCPVDGNITIADSFFVKVNPEATSNSLQFTTAAIDVQIQPTTVT